MRLRHLLSLSIVLILIGLGMLFTTNRLRAESIPAPAWQLQDLDGKTVKLSDFKGKVVILDLWATWCPPCVAEIPNFVALQKQYKKQGLVVIGISLDDGPKIVSSFVKNHGMNYVVVMGDDEVAMKYGADVGIPITLVIDPKGNVVHNYLGVADKSVLEDDIKKLLPAKT
jgi:peroxiredoxin